MIDFMFFIVWVVGFLIILAAGCFVKNVIKALDDLLVSVADLKRDLIEAQKNDKDS